MGHPDMKLQHVCVLTIFAVVSSSASLLPYNSVLAQAWPFPWPEERIAAYTARRGSSPIVIDGRLDEADWVAAERSPRFADLIGGRPGIHDTRQPSLGANECAAA